MPEPRKDDSGPAFPVADAAGLPTGLTRREWFAGQALAGLLSPEIWQMDGARQTNSLAKANEAAYRIADMMIQQRG